MRSFRPQRRSDRPFGRPRFKQGSSEKTVIHIEKFIAEASLKPTHQPVAVPTMSTRDYSEFNLPETLYQAIKRCGYTKATPIQDQVIPVVLDCQDVIGIANTGTGKTAAFLIPLITRVLAHEVSRVLILAPTRELALQINHDFTKLVAGNKLRSVLCIGGTSVRHQMQSLRQEYQFLIGTPGRIKDMMSQRQIPMQEFNGLVLDEVDRMLDMGFIRDVRDILSQLPHDRQSLFFSATLPREVEQLCGSFSITPAKITIPSPKETYPIDQHLIRMESGQKKLEVLYDLLCNQQEFKKVIIFGRTKHGVKRLAQDLDRRGFAVDSIHGNKSQAGRQRSLELFRSHHVSILVATDVAARGIDVSDVTHVINYDIPETLEDYIHRIGRTGRAGKKGIALTFVD